jgi:hypothetical protein
MKVICFSETSANFEQTIRRYIPADSTLQWHSYSAVSLPLKAFACICLAEQRLLVSYHWPVQSRLEQLSGCCVYETAVPNISVVYRINQRYRVIAFGFIFVSVFPVTPTSELRASVKRFVSRQFLNLHTLSGTRTHCPSFRASEDSLCLRRRGLCDRLSDAEEC